MAVTHVNQGSGSGSGTNTITITMSANTTVGNLLILYLIFSNEGRTVSSITGAGTWSEGHPLQTQVGPGGLVIYACKCTGATTSITVTLSGSSGSIEGYVREFNAAPATFAETGTSTALNQTASTAWTVASVTPSVSPCVFAGAISVSANGSPWTDDSDFTYFVSTNAIRLAYRIQSDTTAQSFANTSTASVNGLGMLVAFEASDPAAGGGALRINSILNGLGSSGPFFSNTLG